jgi:hypothetical protein
MGSELARFATGTGFAELRLTKMATTAATPRATSNTNRLFTDSPLAIAPTSFSRRKFTQAK